MVGQRTLTPYVEVRILGPQPETQKPAARRVSGFRASGYGTPSLVGRVRRAAPWPDEPRPADPSGSALRANPTCGQPTHGQSGLLARPPLAGRPRRPVRMQESVADLPVYRWIRHAALSRTGHVLLILALPCGRV